MYYELPFSKPGGWSVQKAVLLGLIVLHTAWIVIHMNLVSRELVNPWKLGGYGMYTTAHARPALSLFDSRMPGFEVPMDDKDVARLTSENKFFIFRCQPLTVASLLNFLIYNPLLSGIPLRFFITER